MPRLAEGPVCLEVAGALPGGWPREGLCAPVSRPRSPPATRSRFGAGNASEAHSRSDRK